MCANCGHLLLLDHVHRPPWLKPYLKKLVATFPQFAAVTPPS